MDDDERITVVDSVDLPTTWRRAAPLWLERLLQRAEAWGPRHGRRRPAAPLSAAPWPAQLPHHVYDTRPDPRSPQLHKTIEASGLAGRAGYSRPHSLHCGPDGVFLTCIGAADGPGGIALLDHSTSTCCAPGNPHRGPQYLAYDAWWHLNQNTLISSEWGTTSMIEDGLVPELLWPEVRPPAAPLGSARGAQRADGRLQSAHQMPLELRASHDPEATWGFVGS